MFNRENAAKTAQSVVDHLMLIEHVKELQEGQAVVLAGLKELGDRIRDMEKDLVVLRAEVKYEAIKEAQGVVATVQGGLNQRMEDLAVKVALLQASHSSMQTVNGSVPRLPAGTAERDEETQE